jgi:hypothetical protein
VTRAFVLLCTLSLLTACSLESPIDAHRPEGVTTAAGRSSTAGQPDANSGGQAALPTTGLNPEVILASGCATETEQSSLVPANILFVVDRSGSMACNPPPTTTSQTCETNETRADPNLPTKWELTSQALMLALDSLPETSVVGVSYFNNGRECGVDMVPSVPIWRNTPAQRSTIAASLNETQPSGDTPLVGATVLAYRYMQDAALSGMITGNRFVVLITDGEQSEQCSDPPQCTGKDACTQFLVAQTAKANTDGVNIRTFVIGAPGTELTRSVLSSIALAGGTGQANCSVDQGNCHFDVTRDADLGPALQRALQNIAGQTLTCELTLPKLEAGTVDPARVNVVFTPHSGRARVLPHDMRAPCDGGADGWQYTADPGQIRLCGNSCGMVRNDSGGRIDVVLGCPVIGPD